MPVLLLIVAVIAILVVTFANRRRNAVERTVFPTAGDSGVVDMRNRDDRL